MRIMTPRLRKLALTAHITTSVGWLGAVSVFLALAVAGLTSQNAQMVRAAYLAMDLTAWLIIVPLSLASPLIGVVQSFGTPWGLFRHYWVVAKLLITILATAVLLLHLQPISYIAGMAAETTLTSADLRGLRIQLIANAGAALLVLLVATALSVYKPQGMTRYGRSKRYATEREHVYSAKLVSYQDSTANNLDLIGRSTTATPRWCCYLSSYTSLAVASGGTCRDDNIFILPLNPHFH